MKFIFFIILFIITPVFVLSQDGKTEVWKDISYSEFYQDMLVFEKKIPVGESYSFKTIYKIYQSYVDQIPVENFEGYNRCRNGKEFMMKQREFLILQDEVSNIRIDTLEHTIYVMPIDSSFLRRSNFDVVPTQPEGIQQIQKKLMNKGETLFHLVLENNPEYYAFEYVFSKDGDIVKATVFSNYAYQLESLDQGLSDKARIELELVEIKKGKDSELKNFMTPKDILQKEGESLMGKGKYKDFEIIDLRN